jgi:hypothetical protein
MGSKDKNFYNAALARQGFGDDVDAVRAPWLSGRREAAADRVPVEIGLMTNLLGPPALVRDRVRLYREAGITTLQAKLDGPRRRRLDTLAQLIDLVDEVNREPSATAPDQWWQGAKACREFLVCQFQARGSQWRAGLL